MRQPLEQPASGESPASLYDDVTARIIGELEQGTVPWVKPWKDASAPLGLPRNATTQRAYTGVNVLVLWDAVMRRGFARQEWLTYRQAQSLGGHVRKGERGTIIFHADTFIPKAERERAAQCGENPSAVPFLKRFVVFNVEQTEGLPAHIVAASEPSADTTAGDSWPEVDALIAATGITIREGGNDAYYHPREDFIRLPPRAAFVSEADRLCTLLHEVSHATAHESRLNRDLTPRFGSSAYGREELIAELASAFLCARFGIEPQVRHADYLASWLTILKADSRAIFHAASQASKAADYIIACGVPAATAEAVS